VNNLREERILIVLMLPLFGGAANYIKWRVAIAKALPLTLKDSNIK